MIDQGTTHVQQHATRDEKETAEIAETAEYGFFSASSAPSAVVFEGGNMRKRRSMFLTTLLTCLMLIGLGPAQPWPTALHSPIAFAQATAQQSALDGIDDYIASVMKEWKVPGLALAVIKDGNVILSKGYGYRDVEKQLPVTSKTLFAIGSISKSFTATVLGTLVDEGKLAWDTPVRTYLPDFQLNDPVSTEQMTPRDLVTHRSGLPRHDGLWYGSSLSRREMYERLRYLEPNKPFRSTWQYQNLMFVTAGYLAGQVAGTTWEDLVRERIFKPLGMTSSNFSVNHSQQTNDYALPYGEVEKTVKRIPFRNIDEVGPAGSINSNVDEMIRYIQFHINKGKAGEKQILSEANAEQMQTPQMVMPGPVQYKELGHSSYGLGLMVTTYRGQKLVTHGGGIDGFISLLSFMPGEKTGVIVLTNFSGNNPVPTILTRNVFDRLLGLDQVDWVGRTKEQQEKAEKSQEEAKKKRYSERKEGTSPSHALADYAGQYRHPGYGVMKVSVDGPDLKLAYNSFETSLKHFHYDIFEVPEGPMNPLGGSRVTFSYNKKGDIDRLAFPLESNVDDIVFARVADESMKQKDFLAQFVGEYELGPATISVALQGNDSLTLSVPGQPSYALIPLRGTTFELKGLNGFSVEFKKNAAGTVTELVSYQPNGTFVAKRK